MVSLDADCVLVMIQENAKCPFMFLNLLRRVAVGTDQKIGREYANILSVYDCLLVAANVP